MSLARADYDVFDHLRHALFWEPDDLMYVHTAYFDDSGKKEQGTLLVGGYVATVKQWDDFSIAWRLLLARKDIREFKRADFNAREIGAWPNPERDHFLADLARTVHEHTKYAFAIGILMPDWHKANGKYQMAENHWYPYPLCARTCIRHVRDWCNEQGYDKQQVQYVFDKGSEHAWDLIELLKLDPDPALRALAPVPANSDEVRPIQAADYLAWEVRHQFIRNLNPQPEEAYRTLYRLLRFPAAKVGIYDFVRLDEMCTEAKMPLRQSQ
jgi:Protein of unknown function (DUF3800)